MFLLFLNWVAFSDNYQYLSISKNRIFILKISKERFNKPKTPQIEILVAFVIKCKTFLFN